MSATVETIPYYSRQYGLPLVRPISAHSILGGGDQSVKVENTLRRKTPNGTLNAGYEGTAMNCQPQKHQILLVGEGERRQKSLDSLAGGKRASFNGRDFRNAEAWPPWNAHVGHGGTGSQNGFPVMNGALHQIPPYYNAQQYFAQTIPSVIQPSFQHLGPTAPGGQHSGPYGPYWQDGTFEPYRPAAVRDPRFYQQPGSSQYTYQSQPWQQSLWMPESRAHIDQLQSGHPTWHGSNMLPPSMPQRFQEIPHDASYVSMPTARAIGPSQQASDGMTTALSVGEEYGSGSVNARQRDRTFAWALQNYRSLLDFLHQTRRQHQTRPGQQHAQVRTAFYPKPPKLLTSDDALPAIRQLNEASAGARAGNTEGLAWSSPHVRDSHGLHRERLESGTGTSKVRPVPVWPSSDPHVQDANAGQRILNEQRQSLPKPFSPASQQHSDYFRTLRRSSGSSVATTMSQPFLEDSPPSRAAAALIEMTKLCSSSDWRWIDGMHLGGCLAYGLGNYEKALRWYTKVLEIDPTHLEATSNLAATYLALGRSQDAEHHWNKVVKAAPNHFEAVEHLVGLLCTQQRSKDAIRVISHVERSLRQVKPAHTAKPSDRQSDCSSTTASRSPCQSDLSDKIMYEFDEPNNSSQADWQESPGALEEGFGSSGFAIPGCDNGRILGLIHAKGNMLYGLGDNSSAASAFEVAVLIAVGSTYTCIQDLIRHVQHVVSSGLQRQHDARSSSGPTSTEPILLTPDQALATSRLCFPYFGELPGLKYLPGGHQGQMRKAIVSTTSNALLSLAKIFQDSMSNSSRTAGVTPLASGVRDILALYYLSLSLQPSPSTANNVGILLASVQETTPSPPMKHIKSEIPGVVPGSGIALALQYYNYGLGLDQHHAHLYTNLGSLLKDIGQLDAAINMYERAVKCDGKFDIALANLANAVKDKGRISDAIVYYKRAVDVSPDFAEAVCGLANALNSVCSWQARGGIVEGRGQRDRWHVDVNGMPFDAKQSDVTSSGWIKRVVDIVVEQLADGERWGSDTLTPSVREGLVQQVTSQYRSVVGTDNLADRLHSQLATWSGKSWEGARITRLIERATRTISWQWYHDKYIKEKAYLTYDRPQLPSALTIPSAPTVLPFHTFTCPVSAKHVRLISQRNALRISVATLRAPWLPKQVFPPPAPPAPCLRVGYVSSDFNNHPLAHLMQSVFGMHDAARVEAYCYATTASDNSVHRRQIEDEAPCFYDASAWSAERLVTQIVNDGIHVLVNLNGYTRGARNEVFAARPAPVQMSFMGFAGTLGAEWCDYLLADETAIPINTLRPWRRNVDVADQLEDEHCGDDNEDWVYSENIIYCRDTFFCCDHRQSAPDARDKAMSWDEERKRRWKMRKELFPRLADDTVIFGNFNQLYKASLGVLQAMKHFS